MRFFWSVFFLYLVMPLEAQWNDAAVHKDSSIITAWATGVEIVRGPQQAGVDSLGPASAGLPEYALGKAGDNPVVSLGDGGFAILTFAHTLKDGPGHDFAVFENSFDGKFLELAFVEVSSDGLNYFPFPSISQNDTINGIGSFGFLDPEGIYNLAGKYGLFYGTPFDLGELEGIAGLDVQNITHVKIRDVVGSVSPEYCSRDSEGSIIADPWPTPFPSSGFDLDAVGLIHTNDPASVKGTIASEGISIYPQPASSTVHVRMNTQADSDADICLFDLSGTRIKQWNLPASNINLGISDIPSGIYYLEIRSSGRTFHQRLIIAR